MEKQDCGSFAGKAFRFAAAGCLAAALAGASVPVAAAQEHYWSDPAYIGPPKGMFYNKEIQQYYEDVLWPETMRAREIWARNREDIENLFSTLKLNMLRSRRMRLLEIERIRELMDDDSPVDRMSRGLLPSDAYGEDVKFLI